jgi:hypothetical protein
MALLQIRRGNNGTKGTLQYGEPFFNSTLQTVQFGASGSEEITLVKLNRGIAGANVWGESGSFENSGSLSLMGDITASNAFFRGNVFVSGNLRLGNNDLDSITVDADFTSDLIPNTSSTYDIGAGGKTWANVYTDNLTLSALSGLDAENNIVYVNSLNALTASNDFEFIPGNQVRIGSGLVDKFTVAITTGNTFISGNLQVHGNTGIFVSGNISSSGGNLFAISGTFANLNQSFNPSAADNGLVFTQGGALKNNSGIRYFDAQEQFNIGNSKFIVNGTNGNVNAEGTLEVAGVISGSSNAIIKGTLQVDGATTLNNQLDVNSRVNIDTDLRVDGTSSFGNGLTLTGSVVLNAGNIGTTYISGNTTLGDNASINATTINGTFNQVYSGSGVENLFVRNSPFTTASIFFGDDNPASPGVAEMRVQSRITSSFNSRVFANISSSGIAVTSPVGGASITLAYDPAIIGDSSSLRVNIGATNGINLNSRTQILSNLSVTGSTILAGGLITTASNILITGVGANQGNIQNFNTASFGLVNVSSSLYVTGSTTILGELKIGDLTTSASGLIEGSASIAGDLTVRGNAVYLGVDRVSTEANLIELASGSTAGFEAEGAGLYVSTSTLGGNASIRYTTTGSSERFIINKGVYIIGDPNDNYGLQISNNTHITGNLDIDGNLLVNGNINLGNVTITNTASIQELIVNNNISGGNNLNIANNAAISGNLTIFGNEIVNGTLKSNGATALHSTLNVTGAVGLNSTLNVTDSTAISGNLNVVGNEIVTGSITVKESSFFEKNLRISGNLQVDGNVDILKDIVNINVSELFIEDKNISIARGSLSSLQSNDGGITIEGPTTAIQFTWDHANQRMNLNKDFNVSGSLLVAGDNIIDTAVALAIALG